MLSPMNAGTGPAGRQPEGKDPDSAEAPAPEVLERRGAVGAERRVHEVPSGLKRQNPAAALRRQGVARFVHDGERQLHELAVQRVSEDEQVDEREEHRRDEQNRLPPESEVGALADRRDPENDEPQAARRGPPGFGLHPSRNARPVCEKNTSSRLTGAIVRCRMR